MQHGAAECDIHQCPGLLIKEEDINIYQIEALEHGTATQGEQIDNAIIILRKSQRYQQRSRQADRQGQKKVDSDQIATITPKSSHTVSICRSQGLINIYWIRRIEGETYNLYDIGKIVSKTKKANGRLYKKGVDDVSIQTLPQPKRRTMRYQWYAKFISLHKILFKGSIRLK